MKQVTQRSISQRKITHPKRSTWLIRSLRALASFFPYSLDLKPYAHCPRFPTAAPRGSPGRVSAFPDQDRSHTCSVRDLPPPSSFFCFFNSSFVGLAGSS
ncbi:Hypothetical predicted protein [Olea europaea subsp. europaea]|uniref:Uncharacterized protein n=1 Tax=Olea europaea subsp. europaea TaxID=158383 RepID=A0A8S0TQS5_OLEEU|nr:Hypothetical predicted protein [Olea europaea subsp. europaea]